MNVAADIPAIGGGRSSFASIFGVERILILGLTPLAEQLIDEIERRPGRRVIVGVLDDRRLVGGGPEEVARLQRIIEKLSPHRLVVALSERRGRTPFGTLLESCIARGVIVEDVVEIYERITGKLAFESLAPMAVILAGGFRPPRFHQAFARVSSLIAALVALIVFAPVIGIVALAIKLDSAGPVFFRQRRVGIGGKPFTLVKFRTMAHGGTRRSEWEGDNRDAVTGVGRFLRAFRIDELPQFLNIIRGDMNLIGPRPHPVSNLELLTLVARNLNELTGAAISCYMLRALVRPGLTGWAQVRYRYANNLEEELEKLRYDLYYVKHLSTWLDIRIALETIKVLRGQKTTTPTPTTDAARVRRLDVARCGVIALLPIAFLLLASAPVSAQRQQDQRPARTQPAPSQPQTPQSATTQTQVVRNTDARDYRIGPDDELEISVWENAALTRTVPVRPDGKISLPLVNDIQAAGLTPMELQSTLAKQLTSFVQAPEVSVIVRGVHSFKVSVVGEVKEPGRFELSGHPTVLDLIALAKGLTEYADKRRIVVLRRERGQTRTIPFAYDKLLSDNGEGIENFFVQPDDIVLVR
jgi:lipopolysaccharide/colanic/teichoic acid biosynthesis glycosyltransferase/protein involved in polysaccharide export with SLBB domain